ncbi:MAG TPA: P27 family phage terminase small subunit [Actinomycetota bacterium]|jgi:P27 family predicted phage terminase small subunit|nr:P27 family phage terminase small subunit [Actinomycetota bacterium]
MPNRPKPVERKRRAGNPGKRALPKPVAIVPAVDGIPRAPVPLDRAGRDLWRTIWSEASEWLAPSDVPMVALLAQFADERARWLALVDEEGLTHTTAHKTMRVHPGVSEVRRLEAAMITVMSLLGLSPSDRARLGLTEVRKLSGLADLMQRRQRDLG